MDLYNKYKGMVEQVASSYFSCPEDAEDAVQEAFLKLLQVEKLGKIPPAPDEADPYIRVVVVNVFKDKYRALRQQEKLAAAMVKQESELSDISDPCSMMEHDEIATAFMDNYELLPEDLRTTLSLRYNDMLSYEQIAAKLSVPIGTVASRISRAKALCGIE